MSVILDEFYVPRESAIVDILKAYPEAREVYQLTIIDFFNNIKKIINSIGSPLDEIRGKIGEIRDLLTSEDPQFGNNASEFYALVTKVKNDIEPVLDELSSPSIGSFYGYDIPKEDQEKLYSYLNSLKERMVRMIAHRIRTPFSNITTSAYLVDRVYQTTGNFQDQRIIDRMNVIEDCLNEFIEIFEELKDFIAVSFKLDRHGESIDVIPSEHLAYIFTDLKEEEVFRNTSINIEFEGAPSNIKVEMDQLKRALRYILINSIDFASAERELEIQVLIRTEQREEKERVYVYIHDNGQGIKPSELSKVFEPFYTQDMVGIDFAKLPGTGCGLGLSIAKGLIERYGNIEIYSEYGIGTTVALDFKVRN